MSVFDPTMVEVTEAVAVQWWRTPNKKSWQWLPDNVRVGSWKPGSERAFYLAFFYGQDDCHFLMFGKRMDRDAVANALKGVLL